MSNVPYPSEYRLIPRRQRRPSFWLLLAAVAVALGLALAWPHPARHAEAPAKPKPAAVVAHHLVAHAPAKTGITVTIGRVTYSCAIPAKPKKRLSSGRVFRLPVDDAVTGGTGTRQ
jgi:hypothetical protein